MTALLMEPGKFSFHGKDVYKRQEPGRFKYVTVHGNYLVSLAAEPNTPFFVSYRWDSCTSPAALCDFAKLIGGFDDIHNCYGDYQRLSLIHI